MHTYRHRVQIYYEDTDHSGLVYHANYLKYFERAREHVLGAEELVRLLRDDGIGFVVYRVEVTFRRGSGFGDLLEIRTTVDKSSDYRLSFKQNVYQEGSDEVLVEGQVELVCVDAEKRLVPLPEAVKAQL
jgi:tol-pal system-associated acyl-CoA thioesterase